MLRKHGSKLALKEIEVMKQMGFKGEFYPIMVCRTYGCSNVLINEAGRRSGYCFGHRNKAEIQRKREIEFDTRLDVIKGSPEETGFQRWIKRDTIIELLKGRKYYIMNGEFDQ